MPAIHLPRLRQQVDDLIRSYASPEIFLRKLRDLFDYYGDRTRRPRQKSSRPSALPSANVPAPVLRHIIMEVAPYAVAAPHAVLALARTLWSLPRLEHRLLAAQMLGKLPVEEAPDVLGLLTTWSPQNHEEDILRAFTAQSLALIQKEAPALLLDQIEVWLSLPPPQDKAEAGAALALEVLSLQKLGLSAMLSLAQDAQFENLPRLYSLVNPFLTDSPKVLRPYVLDLLRQLALRSPQEMAFLLRQQLTDNPSITLTWLARRTLPSLPQLTQDSLRPLLVNAPR